MYVIKRNDGKYVSRPGSEHSYTTKLELARTYKTHEEANTDLCVENETIIEISSLFRPTRS